MNIKVLTYETAKELNELFKSKQKMEDVELVPFDFKKTNKKNIIFEQEGFWKRKKNESIIFLILLLLVIAFFFLIGPILNYFNSIFQGIDVEVVNVIILIPSLLLVYKLYRLLSFRRNLIFKKNKVFTKVFSENKIFNFKSIEIGKVGDIVYASFMVKNIPVNNGILLIATAPEEKTDLISIMETYSEKFGIELNKK